MQINMLRGVVYTKHMYGLRQPNAPNQRPEDPYNLPRLSLCSLCLDKIFYLAVNLYTSKGNGGFEWITPIN